MSGEGRDIGHGHVGEVARRQHGRRRFLSDRGVDDAMRWIVSRLEDLGVVNGVDGTTKNPVPNKVAKVNVGRRGHKARGRYRLAGNGGLRLVDVSNGNETERREGRVLVLGTPVTALVMVVPSR